jgi:hypothetical protein
MEWWSVTEEVGSSISSISRGGSGSAREMFARMARTKARE